MAEQESKLLIKIMVDGPALQTEHQFVIRSNNHIVNTHVSIF